MTVCWKELVLDLGDCDIARFNRGNIKHYLVELCKLIGMKHEDLYWWDYEGDSKGYKQAPDHLKGVSAIQFITTSNITIHTLDVPRKIFLNIFSCKKFDAKLVMQFSSRFFRGKVMRSTVLRRG